MEDLKPNGTSEEGKTGYKVILLIVVLAIMAGGIAWYGVQTNDPLNDAPMQTTVADRSKNGQLDGKTKLSSNFLDEITLPHYEPLMPPGPNRNVFMTNCITCHSPRLVTNQPYFPRKKWEEIVHKMVATYGGHVEKEDQAKIVDYLVSIRGTKE